MGRCLQRELPTKGTGGNARASSAWKGEQPGVDLARRRRMRRPNPGPDLGGFILHMLSFDAQAPTLCDTLGRPLRSLRLSVTDRCNLRCHYCMPEEEYVWLPREDLLTLEETAQLARIFVESGVRKIRLTGGEPLLRRNLSHLVELLASIRGLHELALTTNGVLLAQHAPALRAAGLQRLTISLDTLRPERFRALAGRDSLAEVLAGIRAAADAGFTGTKLDSVLLRGTNDDELFDLLAFGREHGVEVRFLEYMDVAGATRWTIKQVVTKAEILAKLTQRFGRVEPLSENGSAPAQRFCLPDGTTFGIIASTSAPFCRTCDRSRLTADGLWFLCLYAIRGLDLRGPLRGGASPEAIRHLIQQAWRQRDDRGAELRRELPDRRAFIPLEGLRRDPHLEMHTRGG